MCSMTRFLRQINTIPVCYVEMLCVFNTPILTWMDPLSLIFKQCHLYFVVYH